MALHPDFNPVEFDGFRKQAGFNSFTLMLVDDIGVKKLGRVENQFSHRSAGTRPTGAGFLGISY